MDTSTRLKLGFAALMILSGIGVASYPVISNMVAQRHASTAIQNYDETVQSMDTEKLDAAKEAARRAAAPSPRLEEAFPSLLATRWTAMPPAKPRTPAPAMWT